MVHRLGLGFLTLLVVSLIIFFSVELLPGSYANAVLGQAATPEAVAAFERQLGLDRPAPVRYLAWVIGALQGDLGESFTGGGGATQRAVADIIGPRLYNTLFLAAVTAIIAVPCSIVIGLLAALYRNRWFDRVASTVSLITISFPEFFIAYVLAYVVVMRDTFMVTALAQALPVSVAELLNGLLQAIPRFPIIANVSADMGFGEHLWRSVLPSLTLMLVISAHMMRMTRASIINVLASPYVEMALLKGLRPSRVVARHALPNAWAPVANVVAFNLAYLIVGVVVVEFVFVYPGIGQLMVDAVKARDIPVVQACALIFAATYILLNLAADVVSIVTNPRLLYPK